MTSDDNLTNAEVIRHLDSALDAIELIRHAFHMAKAGDEPTERQHHELGDKLSRSIAARALAAPWNARVDAVAHELAASAHVAAILLRAIAAAHVWTADETLDRIRELVTLEYTVDL